MGLLDRFKDKAGDLVEGAKDKVSDVTGVDTDKLLDAADNVMEAGHALSEAADSFKDSKSES